MECYSALKRKEILEFPGGSVGWGSGIPTVAQVTALAHVQSLAWELPHATCMARKKNFF